MTAANALSVLRAVLVVPFVFLVFAQTPGSRLWACLILGLAALTDKLDGVVARKFHQVTEWGKILDPAADKFGVIAGGIALALVGDLPGWFVIAAIVRDVLILSGGLFVKFKRGIVLSSNEAGKWTVGCLSVTLVFALVHVEALLLSASLAVSAAMLAISLFMYVRRFVEVVGSPPTVAGDGPS